VIKFYEFFTDLDETATGYRNSICQVGLVRVETESTSKKSTYVTTSIVLGCWHSRDFSQNDFNALAFDQVWHQIAPYIENQNIVAHNGFGFDFPVWIKHLTTIILPTPDSNNFAPIRFIRQFS
jgi:DNA polymerase-3 subunit epsilon